MQALSGSGKTVNCIKLAARFLINSAQFDELRKARRLRRQDGSALLLLVHSGVLAQQMVEELKAVSGKQELPFWLEKELKNLEKDKAAKAQ